MIYTKYSKLNVIKFKSHVDTVSFQVLRHAIQKNPSNVIYCEAEGKIYGIISGGDIERDYFAGRDYVTINKNFTWLYPNESMKAREIFHEKANINVIPVINKEGVLLGDYKRWDKLNLKRMIRGGFCSSKNIYLIRPCGVFQEKQKIYYDFKTFLQSAGVTVYSINWNEILNSVDQAEEVFVVDWDEYWAVNSFLVLSDKVDMSHKIKTFEQFLKHSWMCEYLHSINESVPVLNLVFRETADSRLLPANFRNKTMDRNLEIDNSKVQKEFLCELYTPEYAEQIMHLPVSVTADISGKLKDCKSKYYNVTNGERHTAGQPEWYVKTVYFIGPCFVYGHFVEDKYTIESFLQKRINDAGYDVRVTNCGSLFYFRRIENILPRIEELPLQRGDIVILYLDDLSIPGISELNLMDALGGSNVEAGWVLDNAWHCNHKVNEIYAEAIFHALEDALSAKAESHKEKSGEEIDVVKKVYIDRYFADYSPEAYKKIGSIVMNCNPFTYGHRYLIEQALALVEFLIIFVVEEDASLFSFEERFSMVCEGTKDLNHVMVVPSGPFIVCIMGLKPSP